MAQSLPITFLFTVNIIRQMAPLFSKVDSNKLWLDVRHEENVIYAQFAKDLFNISKVIGRKKVAQFFLTHSVQPITPWGYKFGELWSTSKKVIGPHIDPPNWTFLSLSDFISAFRGCCPL